MTQLVSQKNKPARERPRSLEMRFLLFNIEVRRPFRRVSARVEIDARARARARDGTAIYSKAAASHFNSLSRSESET